MRTSVPGPVEVLLQRLDPQMPLPAYAHPGDAGADLMTTVDVTLAPGQRQTVPTGVAIALPAGYAAFVHPRSGLASRSGVTVVNAPGTVDAGYRGEIQVTLLNTDASTPVHLRRGDRIAQLIVQEVSRARFIEVERLPGSARGVGGFGSTGGFGLDDAASGSNPEWVPGDSSLVPGISSQVPGSSVLGDSVPEGSEPGNTARGQGEI